MAADIIVYKAEKVPVGHDQLPHLEITREIARRFNYLYSPVFPEPQALLTETPKVVGLDGRKMSKSYGNAIFLSETADETRKKIMSMVTDVERPRKSDPGEPDRCVAFNLHRIYVPEEKRNEIIPACRGAQIGCVECKKILAECVVSTLAPHREKREELAANPALVDDILAEGSKRASEYAAQTMGEVLAALNI
jgi:tryptophanyl-tRNA synthetase